MEKEDLYQDFLIICSMRAPFDCKSRMLTFLLAYIEKPWRVVGITEAALKIFKKNNFKRVPNMKINRSHLVDRYLTHKEMLNIKFKNCNDWWDFFYEKDKTILATSSENSTQTFSRIFEFPSDHNFFKSSGYAWKQIGSAHV